MELTLSFGTEAYLPEGMLGLVRLNHQMTDFSRVDRGQVRYHVDHNWGQPVGRVLSVWFDPEPAPIGRYMAKIDVPEIKANEVYLEQRDAGLRGDTSVGYRITDLRFAEEGRSRDEDKFDARWELLEISDVTVPADVNSGEGRGSYPASLRSAGLMDADSDEILLRSPLSIGIVKRSILTRADSARRNVRYNLENGDPQIIATGMLLALEGI